jgi:transposase
MMHDPAQPISVSSVFVGIDVAKDKLDLARSDRREILTVPNNADGIGQILASLKGMPIAAIVIEATGGLERLLLDAMLEAQLPVALVSPSRVRHFAKAMGILAKTDALDAGVLVEFARQAALRLAEKRSANQVELEALITCRRQLKHVQTEQTNRRGQTHSKMALKSIDAVLITLNRQVKALDQRIAKLIDGDDDLNQLNKRLRGVPGVGAVLSATLLCELTELGSVDRREIGALVGVAPVNHDSGQYKGQRRIHGGRASVRNVLYMATICAMRCNPLIKIFAQRLKAAGKKNKVVIVACMRKLLGLLNAMARDKLDWEQLTAVRNATVGGGAK